MTNTITNADLGESSEDMPKIDHQHQATHILNTSVDLGKILVDRTGESTADDSTDSLFDVILSMIVP